VIRRAILVLLLLSIPLALLASDTPAGEHHEKLYFGVIPAWVMKLINMLLFFGLLYWLLKGPIAKAFRERTEAVGREAEEARQRRARAEQMAGEIQTRLAQMEDEVKAIGERAQVEGERQKRELMAAAEAEGQKILQAARNEIDNRLKFARHELTEYAGMLATERAEALLREEITEEDRRKLFQESLREVTER
jgi:F-type H+-transporting ATPase subunit b